MTAKKSKLLQNLTELALILLTAAVASLFIFEYCDLFHDFGLAAKNRLVKNPLIAFFTTPIFFWISAIICRRFAQNAAGNTLDHIQSALINLKKHPDSFEKISPFLNLRIVATNCLSSLLSTFGGGALGREAPSVYISASIFAVIASKVKFFLPKISLEKWILIGNATGLTIAFNAPIAGLLYVAEKLIHIGSTNFFRIIFWTIATALVPIAMLHKSEPLFTTNSLAFAVEFKSILIALIAIICGLAAFMLKKISNFFYQKFSAVKSNFWHLIPIIGGFTVSAISFYAGIYSFSGGIKTAQDALGAEVLLSHKEVLGRMANTILTFASGCAGGLVAPAIALGAGVGSIFSQIIDCLDAKILILSSMAAFLSPFLGLPFAAAMVILETTNQPISALPFLLFPAIISFATEKLANRLSK
jgi:H+/Cl- antiporter ClcA